MPSSDVSAYQRIEVTLDIFGKMLEFLAVIGRTLNMVGQISKERKQASQLAHLLDGFTSQLPYCIWTTLAISKFRGVVLTWTVMHTIIWTAHGLSSPNLC